MLIRHFASVIHIFLRDWNEIVRSNCLTERNKEIVFLSHWLLFMHSRIGLISCARTSDSRKKEKEQKCNRAPTDYGSLKWNGLIKKDTWCGRRAKHNDVVIIYNGLDISSLSVSGTQERAISFLLFFSLSSYSQKPAYPYAALICLFLLLIVSPKFKLRLSIVVVLFHS